MGYGTTDFVGVFVRSAGIKKRAFAETPEQSSIVDQMVRQRAYPLLNKSWNTEQNPFGRWEC